MKREDLFYMTTTDSGHYYFCCKCEKRFGKYEPILLRKTVMPDSKRYTSAFCLTCDPRKEVK